MSEEQKDQQAPPTPHDSGYHPVPPLEQMEEDECGDPADETKHRQTSITTHRSGPEGSDLKPN